MRLIPVDNSANSTRQQLTTIKHQNFATIRVSIFTAVVTGVYIIPATALPFKYTTMLVLLILLFSAFLNHDFFSEKEKTKLQISHLTGDYFIYTTYQTIQGKLFPANGMYVVTNQGVILLDTPWDTTQFQPLIDSIKMKHNRDIVLCIATHSHEDRTAGLEFLRQKGVKTYTTKVTDEISKRKEGKRAEFTIEKDTTFTVGQHSLKTHFPGEGHTADNIVVWFDEEKILYGGCLIKSTEANDLGNLADANVKGWETTIKALQKAYPKPKYIIPGHQNWTSNRALVHTLKLVKQRIKQP